MNTGSDGRNEAMREHLDTEHHGRIRFDAASFEARTVDAEGLATDGIVRGALTIHGVTHDVEMPCRLRVDDGRRLSIEGEASLLMSDYDVEVPSKLGIISVEDKVTVWVALRARLDGGKS